MLQDFCSLLNLVLNRQKVCCYCTMEVVKHRQHEISRDCSVYPSASRQDQSGYLCKVFFKSVTMQTHQHLLGVYSIKNLYNKSSFLMSNLNFLSYNAPQSQTQQMWKNICFSALVTMYIVILLPSVFPLQKTVQWLFFTFSHLFQFSLAAFPAHF